MKKTLIIVLLFVSIQNVYARVLSDHLDLYYRADTTVKLDYNYKNPQKALMLSIANTVVPVGLGAIILENTTDTDSQTLRITAGTMLIYGIIIGPSIGTFYDGYYLNGLGGIGFRILTGTVGVAAFAATLLIGLGNGFGGGQYQSTVFPVAITTGCAILVCGSAIFQIIKAPILARKHNQSYRLTIAPTYFYREKSLGLAMNVQF